MEPEQISNRLRSSTFPADESMRISRKGHLPSPTSRGHGACRGVRGFRRHACEPVGRSVSHGADQPEGCRSSVTPEVMISKRPSEADDRAIAGHWEGDLIIGLNRSAIGTLVEQTTRFTMLLHLPRMEGHDEGPRVQDGPPLAGLGAEAVRNTIAASVRSLQRELWRSLSWDQGSEITRRPAQLERRHGAAPCPSVTPAKPRVATRNQREHQRTASPNISRRAPICLNGALDDLEPSHSPSTEPAKTLGWETPAEALDKLLRSPQQGSVATTP